MTSRTNDYVASVIRDWNTIQADIDLRKYELVLRFIRIGRIVEEHAERVVTAGGLNARGDFEVLSALRRAKGTPLRPNELADRLMVTTAGMTGRLDRLERANYVERRLHPSDRRGVEVVITSAGAAVCDAVLERLAQEYAAVLRDVPDPIVTRLAADLAQVALALGDEPPQ